MFSLVIKYIYKISYLQDCHIYVTSTDTSISIKLYGKPRKEADERKDIELISISFKSPRGVLSVSVL